MVGGSGGSKVVATLRADGKVYPTEGCATNYANLINYKIRTEGEQNKSVNSSALCNTTTVVDLGKQLLQCARDSDINGVKTALSRGAPFTNDWLGMTALHFAAMNNQYEICDLLLKGGINKDSKTKVDRTPLHLACFYGHERIVELLLSKKCAINPRDMLRMTPIHWAVEKRHKHIARLLIKHNADVTLPSKFGKTPIALAVLTEQADILEELEAARQAQINRKFNEENETETSEAVNSILGGINNTNNNEVIEEPDALRKIDMDVEDDFTIDADYTESKINLDHIKETAVFDNSTINLLKSHGISMIQDADDESKHLLNTALQNGRQLVLSEGGKLLLNDTIKRQNNVNLINHNNNYNNSHNNINNAIVPIRNKTDLQNVKTSAISHHGSFNTKIRPNIISKAKDNPSIAKNKNIRIISLNDFKRLYGNSNIKTMQKLPASLANSRLVKHLVEETKLDPQEKKLQTNLCENSQTNEKSKSNDEIIGQLKASKDSIVNDFDPMSNIIQVGASDSEFDDGSDNEPIMSTTKLTQPMRFIPAKRVEHIGSIQMRAAPAESAVAVSHRHASATTNKQSATASPSPMVTNANASTATGTAVLPLLSMPEICRQLLELRRQNDELRRKFDLAQKEKEEMRQRLERLEELLLVEKTDEVFIES